MNKMQEENEYLFNLDYDKPYNIECLQTEERIIKSGRKNVSLNGTWNFTIDVFDTFYRKKFFEEKVKDAQGNDIPVDFSFDQWEEVEVPSVWNLARPEYFFYEGTSIYTRTFELEELPKDIRVYLNIGAANYETRIWINKKYIARHLGGFTPFSVDITDYLQKDNRITITVNNERKLEQLPSKNYDWFNYGGIFRDVELIYVPTCHIQDFFVSLVPDGKFDKISVKAKVGPTQSKVTCRFRIDELGIDEVIQTDEEGSVDSIFKANPTLWEVNNPKLYSVSCEVGEDKITELVGFREIKTLGSKIMFNGKEIFLKGVCCHEESLEHGRALSHKDRLGVIKTAKEMGCNILRLAHYPHSEEMAKLADQEGILLWEELPVYWTLCFSNEGTIQDARNQLKELLLRDRNRASVIIWSIGNENPDTDERLQFMSQLAKMCRELDHSRLISAACLVDLDKEMVADRLMEHLDIISFNEYYGWYNRDYNQLDRVLSNWNLDKPLMISETGAGAKVQKFGGEEELFTEEHQAHMYKKQIEIIRGKVQGFFPWLLFDSRSPVRMNIYQQKFNIKGLVAADKTYRKKAFYVMQEYYCGGISKDV